MTRLRIACVASLWLSLLVGCAPADAKKHARESATPDTSAAPDAGGIVFGDASGDSSEIVNKCAGTRVVAERVPLDLFMMLDRSGSMGFSSGGDSKWVEVKRALYRFVNLPEAAGIGVGLQYFGKLISNSESSCNPADYASAEVPIAPLPGNGQAILDSIGATEPSTGTPTAPALEGSISYVRSFATQNPTHIAVNVFITDGQPAECDTDMAKIAAIARAGFEGTPAVRTFVIGIWGVPDPTTGDNGLENMDVIAAAGGTEKAFLINTVVAKRFVDALNEIRTRSLGCRYALPKPQSDRKLDLQQVNVQYTPSGDAEGRVIPHVQDAQACGVQEGWFYNPPDAPTQIVMCDGTCETLAADLTGVLQIELGCETVVR